jgi:hypothetical protein
MTARVYLGRDLKGDMSDLARVLSQGARKPGIVRN